ncbi:hypothetical protein BY458DRAFT_486846 [Sporodiniella umbellata]|nr:hypothetical protein BY458DRAFT_486846 [Sporodiniella umbellata]
MDICENCDRIVYVIEKVEVNGRSYHKNCFKVETKSPFVLLNLSSVKEMDAAKSVLNLATGLRACHCVEPFDFLYIYCRYISCYSVNIRPCDKCVWLKTESGKDFNPKL